MSSTRRILQVLSILHMVLTAACVSQSTYSKADLGGSYVKPDELNLPAGGHVGTVVQLVARQRNGTVAAGVQLGMQIAPAALQMPTWAPVDGRGVAESIVTPNAAGSYDLQLVVRLPDYQSVFSTARANLNVYTPGTQPGVSSGTKLNRQVLALDSNGFLRTNYRGTLHFTSSDPLATLPADVTMTAADAGSKMFVAQVVLRSYGQQSVTVTDADHAVLSSQSYTIVPADQTTQLTATLTASRMAGIVADGQDATVVSISVVDGTGTAVTGVGVNLSVTGSNNVFTTPLTTDANGQASTTLTSTMA